MEVEQPKPAMTFDEVSMERSKNFVKALRELKNLRPQLYSAAEYCEKSYLHNEQKQMVLDHLKDYAVRALVNAVDHLGTVAYKLTDLLEQQSSDVSTMELKLTCLNQDKEGLRQQQLLAIIPRHHKHYILPNSVNKKVHFSPHVQTDPRQTHAQAKPRVHPSGSPASKTLSWHLASETKSTLKGTEKSLESSEIYKTSLKTSPAFHLLDNGESIRIKTSSAHPQMPRGDSVTGITMQPFGVTYRDPSVGSRSMIPFRSFDNNSNQQAIICAPIHSKSMLSAIFLKKRTLKLKTGTVP
ncbi:Protein abil1 [Ancistrocladus abbreviatus]